MANISKLNLSLSEQAGLELGFEGGEKTTMVINKNKKAPKVGLQV